MYNLEIIVMIALLYLKFYDFNCFYGCLRQAGHSSKYVNKKDKR
jgi:hypothetical protein